MSHTYGLCPCCGRKWFPLWAFSSGDGQLCRNCLRQYDKCREALAKMQGELAMAHDRIKELEAELAQVQRLKE